ncbi:uncharacterized protein LOC130743676 [Lotus japonicus]|uniref:uncharacterized protein LOC130743676 n=1 Tax=Lotus japonicus TaxID=34305 RepID=UPI002585BF25|nr:uncharacterized protein LOC130743676 [Lotus japonicus]
MTRRPNTRGRRCLSTPNDQSGSSQMNLPSAQVGSNHSASITNTGSSSQEGVQTNPTSPNEVHANAQDGPQVAASSSTQRKPKNASWNVNVIDPDGHIIPSKLRAADVLSTRTPNRILTQWNSRSQPVGESGGLLGQALGLLASNFSHFPIVYENWKIVPDHYKDSVYATIKEKFVVNDDDHRKFILTSLGKKWRDNKSELFLENYDWEVSMAQNIQNPPVGIEPDHWILFVQHKLSDKQREISEKNAANRAKQVIPHTLGSKSLARKRDELELQDGRPYSRADMYLVSHQKNDGTYVNDEARLKCDQLRTAIENCSSENEAFVDTFGKERPGYVRGMGLGVTPSQLTIPSFNRSTLQNDGLIEKMQSEIESLKEKAAEVDALKAQVTEMDVLKEQLAFLMQEINLKWSLCLC